MEGTFLRRGGPVDQQEFETGPGWREGFVV